MFLPLSGFGVPSEPWKTTPGDWVFYMPHLSATRRAELRALGIEAISAIPDDFRLSPRQKLIRDVTRSGTAFIGSDLRERLKGFGPPAFYLDFEAILPAIPLYAGTRPYQTIPFQWSLHHVDAHGAVTHQEFLGDPRSDPRRSFAQSLLASLRGTKVPVVVYSSYEQARLTELAKNFPRPRDVDPWCRKAPRRFAAGCPWLRVSP
jgi:hypothetical protein